MKIELVNTELPIFGSGVESTEGVHVTGIIKDIDDRIYISGFRKKKAKGQ